MKLDGSSNLEEKRQTYEHTWQSRGSGLYLVTYWVVSAVKSGAMDPSRSVPGMMDDDGYSVRKKLEGE